MTDPKTETVAEQTAESTTEVEAPDLTPSASTESLEEWKRNARKWEKLAKADAEAAAAWREYEAAQKPVQERLAEELAATKAEAAKAQQELLRLQIASQKGITGDAARLLKGATQEELEAEADIILSMIQTAQANTPKTPTPDPSQGKPSSSTAGAITDINQLDRMTPEEIMKAKADGRLDSLLGKN